MKFSSSTTYAISRFSGRHCIRFTELCYVVVAVFAEGCPQFVSKDKLRAHAIRQDIGMDKRLRNEWKIGRFAGMPAKPATTDATIIRRMERAGLVGVELKWGRVSGFLPTDEFDRQVAKSIAKDNGWSISGNAVTA